MYIYLKITGSISGRRGTGGSYMRGEFDDGSLSSGSSGYGNDI